MATKAVISISNKYSEYSGGNVVAIFPKRYLDKAKEKDDKERLKDINVLLYFMRHQFLTALSHFQDGLGESVGHFLEQHPEWARAVETMRLTPSTVVTPAAEQAPPLWAEAQEQGDTPPAFIQRHYQGRTRVDLYRRDPELLKALYAWTKENGLPQGFDLQPPLWAEAKEPGDTPPDFIQRHYGPWLGKGFNQADLRQLDPQAEMAWRHWKRKNKPLQGFHLPTKSEQLAADTQLAADSPEATATRRLAYRLDKQRRSRS